MIDLTTQFPDGPEIDGPERENGPHAGVRAPVTEAELRHVLVEWNDTSAEYPADVCLHELFAAQAARTPDAVALVFDGRPPTEQGSGVRGQGSAMAPGNQGVASPIPDPRSPIPGPWHLTYAELNRRANRLAWHLRALGVGPEVLVGICVERSLELIVGILGILKAGGAYVPLDPAYPPDRLAFMLEDSRAPVLLTSKELGTRDWGLGLRNDTPSPTSQAASRMPIVVYLDAEWPGIAREADESPPSGARAENCAYVLFTSGSTGRPKGVACAHRGVINLLADFDRRAPLAPGDAGSLWTSLSFDVSVYEIFAPLLAGGNLHLVPEAVRADGSSFVGWLRTHAVASAYLPPFMVADLAAWLGREGARLALRRLLVGVEPIKELMLAAIGARLPELRIINGYGPTEATVCATLYEVVPGQAQPGNTPIGRPVQNTRLYVLDSDLRPVPIGAAGELYIGGDGLARGYLNRPDLTAERFVPNPFADEPGTRDLGRGARDQERPPKPLAPSPKSHGARLYRTGDLVRYRADGNVEFLGRIDQQVKVRGFRIELGEIAAALNQHPGVREVVVLAREDVPGEKRLVAYIVPATDKVTRRQGDKEFGDASHTQSSVLSPQSLALSPQRSAPPSSFILHPSSLSAELRAFLKERLPEYMVPAAFVLLDALPQTPNGKIDRRALPAPDWEAAGEAGPYVAPHTPVEEVLAGMWAELLGVERVSRDASFFVLGGHSLLATQVIARVRETFGVDLSPHDLFRAPTVAGLAESIARAGQAAPLPPLAPVPRDRPLPLTFPQERVWFLNQLAPGNIAYNAQISIRFGGPLQVALLERALTEIVRRHEILRTSFPAISGRPVQIVHPPQPVHVPVFDLRDVPGDVREARAEELIAAELRIPFDVTRIPLARWRLFRLGEEEYVLLQVEHHFVHDGWSLALLLRELKALYAAFHADEPSSLPELPVQYADFAAWQREWLQGEVLAAQLAYWKRQLAGSPPVLALPTDRPRPKVQSFRGAGPRIELPLELYHALKALSRREGVTLFMTLLAAFTTLLARYTGQEDILVGSGVANRRLREVEQLIGMVVNTVVLRTDLSGDPTFRELLSRVRAMALDAYAHQDIPVEQLVAQIQPERDLGRNPLFQVMFSFHDSQVPDLDFAGLRGQLLERHNGSAKADLNVIVIPRAEQRVGLGGAADEKVVLLWEYSTDLFDATTIDRMVAHYRTLLEAIVADPARRIADLPLLPAAERAQLLVEWNATTAGYPRERMIHELVAAQAARIPDAVALAFDGRPTTEQESGVRGQGSAMAPGNQGASASISDPRSPIPGPWHLTYAELDRRANQLAHHLCVLGVGPEVRVGVCLERTPELAIALLGVLKAGGAYVPLDPAYPPARLTFMLEDAQAAVLLTQRHLLARLPDSAEAEGWGLGAREKEPAPHAQAPSPKPTVLCLDAGEAITPATSDAPVATVSAGNLAYVIYTSGSTGTPKGVEVPHGGLLNLVHWHLRAYAVTPADRASHLAGLGFDASVWELWPYLAAGACVALAEDAIRAAPDRLRDWLLNQAITISFLPTPLAEAALSLDWPPSSRLRLVLTGGDQLRRYPAPELPFALVNHYGPTESSVVASAASVPPRPVPTRLPPIGRPIANTRLYVLDGRMQPVPIGVPGELYIGGDGLARGYHGRPDLTAERFIPNPFAKDEGRRMKDEFQRFILHPSSFILYRTGDLVRWLPEGEIEFLGRIDQQVKVRGFRIELGEVEAALAQHPAVRECVVVAREDVPGEKRLVAYVVPATDKVTRRQGDKVTGDAGDSQSSVLSPQDSAPPSSFILHPSSWGVELRAFLKERLPDYMVPAAFVVLDALPITANGKVDRQALPAPDNTIAEQERTFVAPRTPVEERLAGIWAQFLGLERVGIYDNFFALGGHSLLATRIMAQVCEAFQVELSLGSIFETPTVASMAEAIIRKELEQADSALLADLLAALDQSSAGDGPAALADEGSTA